MAQTRIQKQDLIERYEGGLAAAKHAFLVDFQGLTVSQATDLRSRIREQGGSYEVVKNRLALRAIEGRVPRPTQLPPGCVYQPRCRFARDRCRQEEPNLTNDGSDHHTR